MNTRRQFLLRAVQATAATSVGLWSLERNALLASAASSPSDQSPRPSTAGMPMGRLGKLQVSRLILGGNLISGFSHTGNLTADAKHGRLIYVDRLFKNYFDDETVFKTWHLAEQMGINTTICRADSHVMGLLTRYWNNGGKLQWIAQTYPGTDTNDKEKAKNDLVYNVRRAVDTGASAVFIVGGTGDKWVETQEFDKIKAVVDFGHQQGIPVGMGGHAVEVPKAVRAEGFDLDFVFKTINPCGYESLTPQETVAVMAEVKKPWVAYKTLGAGTVKPADGFRYALEGGADFLNVGMFDFQIEEDVRLFKGIVATLKRKRAWCA